MAQKALIAGVVAGAVAVGVGLVALSGGNAHGDGSGKSSGDTVTLAALPTSAAAPAGGADLPVAIFHAFDEPFSVLQGYVCTLADQGYSHVQIPPAQKSHDTGDWKGRYQPIDFSVIEGRGSETELASLIQTAHGCGIRIIADVVFNHMTDAPPFYVAATNTFNFPGLSAADFNSKCHIEYSNGRHDDEIDCWLNDSLPDLKQQNLAVQNVTKGHLSKLIGLGIDGFRFDAAKHMDPSSVQMYIDHVNSVSGGKTWNYLEVIEDDDTHAKDYNRIAAITDFRLYKTMKDAFSFGGNLTALRVPVALDDPRSVVFGINHDTDSDIHDDPIYRYNNRADSVFATAYVLAREAGVPLVLRTDNLNVSFIRFGVKFRQIMRQRGTAGAFVKDNVLGVIDSGDVLFMERGEEGFFIVNKSGTGLDLPVLDLTLTHLEGCYRELRNNFLVAIERRPDNKKYVTRWGTWQRGGVALSPRDALYFIREPWNTCAS